MAFDMGFNFRNTSGFVTDPSYCVLVNSEVYPHTYTTVDGYSINAGWPGTGLSQDSASGNDPRIAGVNYTTPNNERVFRIDLDSGSAPGAGTYTVDLAAGQVGFSHNNYFDVRDSASVLIQSAGSSTVAGQYLDATLTPVSATTSWTGTTASKTFETTICYLVLNPGGVNNEYDVIAHFRLTLQVAPASNLRRLLLNVGL